MYRYRTTLSLDHEGANLAEGVNADVLKWIRDKGKDLPGLVRHRRAEAAL
jgi:hypothetical protein